MPKINCMKDEKKTIEHYLQPTNFVNSDHPKVIAYAKEIVKEETDPKAKAILLFYHIRDAFRYNPYQINSKMKATDVLEKDFGHCVDKACLLAACGRAVGIPSRLGFGAVRNHIGTSKLEETLGTNVLAFHGYMEFYLDGKWVKATPAFNKALCDKLKVTALDFDGENDCLFQAYEEESGQFMEYLADYGQFDDIPVQLFIEKIKEYYPHLFGEGAQHGAFELGELSVAL